ncbi:MAG: hypothetical protein IKP86_03835 [Anaerolineaceae bacterium]|nr:hypothetical protein [Anaerolineaceae bacterium]
MKNNKVNFMSITAALAAIIAVFIPFAGVNLNVPLLEFGMDFRVMDYEYGWILLVMSLIGLISGLLDKGIVEALSGAGIAALTYYGRTKLIKAIVFDILGWPVISIENGIGYYVLFGAGIVLLVSSMFSIDIGK